MDWQFGHNCTRFVPALNKCRMKIDLYNQKADLLTDRLLKTREILVYTGWSLQELMDRVERGDVRMTRVQKPKNPERDGYLRYRLRCAWQWDGCGMAVTGGMCEWYESTAGPHITCIADLQNCDLEHPNMAKVPTLEDVEMIERQLFTVESRSVV